MVQHLKRIPTLLTIIMILCGTWLNGSVVAAGPNLGTQLKSELNRLLNDGNGSIDNGVNVEVRFRITASSQLDVLEVIASDVAIRKTIRKRLHNAVLAVNASAMGKVFQMTLDYRGPRSSGNRTQKKKLND